MNAQKLKERISELTLEEKAGLCSGKDFWHTKDIENGNIGIPCLGRPRGPSEADCGRGSYGGGSQCTCCLFSGGLCNCIQF